MIGMSTQLHQDALMDSVILQTCLSYSVRLKLVLNFCSIWLYLGLWGIHEIILVDINYYSYSLCN